MTTKRLVLAGVVCGGLVLLGASGVYIKRHGGLRRSMAQIRALFDRADLPRREQMIRNTIKREGLWFR